MVIVLEAACLRSAVCSVRGGVDFAVCPSVSQGLASKSQGVFIVRVWL